MITAVVLTKNEEKNISKCIKSLLWCDEVLVIDDYSVDKTVETVRSLGVKSYKHHLDNDFAKQRNFGLSKAKNEWILFVDADEIVSKILQDEIQGKIKNTNCSGFYMKRSDYFLGKELRYGETGRVKLLRLAKKGKGKWHRKVHEYWKIEGEVSEFQNSINHFPHPTIYEFITKVNYYSLLHACENKKEGKESNVFKVVFYPVLKFTAYSHRTGAQELEIKEYDRNKNRK